MIQTGQYKEWTCRRKSTYATGELARRAQQRMQQRYPETTAALDYYPCKVCGLWHVGTIIEPVPDLIDWLIDFLLYPNDPDLSRRRARRTV